MGLFRALTVILVGMFSISLLKSDNIQKLPLPYLNKFLDEKIVKKYKPEIVVILIAIVFLFI